MVSDLISGESESGIGKYNGKLKKEARNKKKSKRKTIFLKEEKEAYYGGNFMNEAYYRKRHLKAVISALKNFFE